MEFESLPYSKTESIRKGFSSFMRHEIHQLIMIIIRHSFWIKFNHQISLTPFLLKYLHFRSWQYKSSKMHTSVVPRILMNKHWEGRRKCSKAFKDTVQYHTVNNRKHWVSKKWVKHTNVLSVETFKIMLLPLRKDKFILCILLTFSLI